MLSIEPSWVDPKFPASTKKTKLINASFCSLLVIVGEHMVSRNKSRMTEEIRLTKQVNVYPLIKKIISYLDPNNFGIKSLSIPPSITSLPEIRIVPDKVNPDLFIIKVRNTKLWSEEYEFLCPSFTAPITKEKVRIVLLSLVESWITHISSMKMRSAARTLIARYEAV